MTSYDTNQYQLDNSPSSSSQDYQHDQYDGSDSSSTSSPQNSVLSNFSQKNQLIQEDYSTPSTDESSHNNDDSNPTLNYQLNANLIDQNKTNFANLMNYGYQFFNPCETFTGIGVDNVLQSYSVANFDPNFVANSFLSMMPKTNLEKAQENLKLEETNNKTNDQKELKPKVNIQNAPAYLMQPPDSESIKAATASAKKNRPTRRSRTKFEKEQLDILELAFKRTHYPDVNVVDRLAKVLDLTTERISVWFQNRRARFKRSKKETNQESLNESLNPILDEHGVFDNNETDKIKNFGSINGSIKKRTEVLEDEKNETINSYDENESYNEESSSKLEKSVEKVKTNPVKPIFNPITLPPLLSITNNSNLIKPLSTYVPQLSKQDSFSISNIAYSSQPQSLKLPVQNNESEHNSSSESASSFSPESSPKLKSEQSYLDQKDNIYSNMSQPIYPTNQIQTPQTNLQPFLNMGTYHSGLNNNNNLYNPHYQGYAPNFPNIFQPYIDYKPELPNPSYYNGINTNPVSNFQTYYNNQQIY